MRLLKTLCIVTLGLTSICVENAIADSKFEILTEEQIGFKDESGQYTIGMSEKDFREYFGDPDKEVEQYLCYFTDGLIVRRESGLLKSFEFCMAVRDISGLGKFQAAMAETDRGATASASLREFKKLHGEPEEDEEGYVLGRILTYPWGLVIFDEDGRLSRIVVRSRGK